MKNLIVFLIDLFIIYLIIVGADAVRIKNEPYTDLKPFIILDESKTETDIVYKSLGYQVEYYLDEDGNIYGGSFILFDKFIIFGYVS